MRIPTTAPTNPRRRPACSAACFAVAVAVATAVLSGHGHATAPAARDADPANDVLATRRIAGVWKNGYAVARVAPKQVTAPAGATIPADGRIDDFEGSATATGGTTPAKFGAGWTVTTDQMAGGVSPGGRGPGARPIGTRCQ